MYVGVVYTIMLKHNFNNNMKAMKKKETNNFVNLIILESNKVQDEEACSTLQQCIVPELMD